jgi:hypothetical protein
VLDSIGDACPECPDESSLEHHTRLGQGRGDHVGVTRLLGDRLMEEIAAGAPPSGAAFIDRAAIARSQRPSDVWQAFSFLVRPYRRRATQTPSRNATTSDRSGALMVILRN